MKIDIIFGTNSSGTYEAARIVEEVFLKAGHTVSLTAANLVDPKSLGTADLTILGSCTWERFDGNKRLEGQLQQHMFNLVQSVGQKKFPNKKFAIFALGDSSYTNFANAAKHLETFVQTAGAKQVGDSLRIDGWFFTIEKNRELIRAWARQIEKAAA